MRNRSAKLKTEVLALLRATDIPPHLVYAYEKTGLLVMGEDGYQALPIEHREEYDAAIDEYFAKEGTSATE